MIKNSPPKDADPSELWVKLSALPRPVSAEHEFKAKNAEVGNFVFWTLTAEQLSWVRVEAHKATKALLGEETKPGIIAYEEEYENQRACFLLSLACRQAADPRFPIFATARGLREQLTDDEIAVALVAYAHFRRESGPILEELTPEEMEAWIKLLQEGASRAPLARLSGAAASDLILYLVSKLGTSATGTSSAGSPPAESATPVDARENE